MLKPFLIIAATLVGATTILWGFPGSWALLAVVPAFILAATIHYFRRPRHGEQPQRVRPGVLVLGGFFGLGMSMATVMVMWAAVTPPAVAIEASVFSDASPQRVWEILGDPTQRPRWHTWMKDVEVTGRGGPPATGRAYRSELQLGGHDIYANHVITAYEPGRRFAWTVAPQGGSRLEDISESVTLEPEAGGTRVRYALTYAVRSVMGRVVERLAIRRSIEKVAERSLELLAGLAEE